MEEIIGRYEKLKKTVNDDLEASQSSKEMIDVFNRKEASFEDWLKSVEMRVANFDPVILKDDVLAAQREEAEVRLSDFLNNFLFF